MTVQISQATVPESDVDTSPSIFFDTRRPYVAIPTDDVRMFITNQLLTLGVGFAFGVAAGALLGNFISDFRRKLPQR